MKKLICTGPYSAVRARDVLDILLIDMLHKLDAKEVRAAAEQVFEERAAHAFPPTVQLATEFATLEKPLRQTKL